MTLAAMALVQQSLAQAAGTPSPLEQQDRRLATVAERLLGANRALCRQLMPLTGMVIHSADQYPGKAFDPRFASGPVSVELVLADGAAASLVRAGDGLEAIGPVRIAGLARQGVAPLRDSVFDVLAVHPADAPLTLALSRGGEAVSVELLPRAGCRALVEVSSASTLDARSDGRVIQVSYGLAAAASDEQLAVTFAHELAHVVLEHRRRLSAAGVEKGFFGEIGRNQQLNRQVEVEADRLSVHLLANAGYDPRIAPAFWRSALGKRAGRGVLRSATYPSPEARARLIEREIAGYLGAGSGPSWPGHLIARRDTAF